VSWGGTAEVAGAVSAAASTRSGMRAIMGGTESGVYGAAASRGCERERATPGS
jgi:hypothetical protein